MNHHTDAFVTLAYFGLVLLVICLGGWAGEKYLMRRDRIARSRRLRERIGYYGSTTRGRS